MSPSSGFMRIEPIKVSGYDGHGDGQGEDPGDGAGRPDNPSDHANRYLVPVPDRRHGDDRPPECVRDAVDLGSFDAQLGVVDSAGIDKQANGQGDQEQAESFDAGLEGQHEHL